MNNDREKKRKAISGVWKWVFLSVFLGVISEIEDTDVLITVVVLALLAFGVGWLISKAVRRRRIETEGEEYERRRDEAQEARYIRLRLVQKKLRGLRIATIVLFGVMMLIAFNISARYEETFYLVFGLIIFALIGIWIIMPIVQYRKISAGFKQTEERPRAAADEAVSEKRTTSSSENFDLDEYDRRKRIEQLDGFLESGLIDREEYRRMKERYEKR